MVGIESDVVEIVVGGIAPRLLDDDHLVVLSSVDGITQAQHGGTEDTAHWVGAPGRQPGARFEVGGGVEVRRLEPGQPFLVGPVLRIERRLPGSRWLWHVIQGIGRPGSIDVVPGPHN